MGIVAFKYTVEDLPLLFILEEYCELIFRSHGSKSRPKHLAHGAGHGGMDARVLPQYGSQKRGAGARQAGDKVYAGKQVVPLPNG